MKLGRFGSEREFFRWMLEGITGEDELFHKIVDVAQKIRDGEEELLPYFRSFIQNLSTYVRKTGGDFATLRNRLVKAIGFLGEEFLNQCLRGEGEIKYNKIRDFLRVSDLAGFLNTARGFYRLIEELKRNGTPYLDIIKRIPELDDRDLLDEKLKEFIERHGEEKTIRLIASFLKYPEIRKVLEVLLNTLDRDRVIDVLIDFYIDTDDNLLSEQIYQYLLAHANDVIPHIDRFIKSKDMVLIVKGLRLLKKGKPDLCIPRIGELLKHPNPVIQKEALRVLMEIEDKWCVEIIKERFFYLTGEEQIEALRFLGDKGEIEFIKEISKMPGLSMNEELFNLVNEILKERQ